MYLTPEAKAEAKRRDRMKYQLSARGRAKRAAWNAAHPETVAASYAKYRESEGYRAAQARYAQSEHGKSAEAAYQAWVKASQPIRVKARAAVATALRKGIIQRPEACDRCSAVGPVDAHHHCGWEPEQWLNVTWLCRRCHKAAHMRAKAA